MSAPWAGITTTCAAVPAPVAIPAQQQAAVQRRTGGPDVLRIETIPVPRPGTGELLIRVHAAALNPADLIWLQRPAAAGTDLRRVAGNDLAGVIVAAGPDTPGRPIGMAVFGITDRESSALSGAFAEYALVHAQNVAPKPSRLTYAEAAGLGVVGVTVLRVLDQTQVRAGQRVLITGVAGGVGSTAAQVAIARGAVVIGTASPRHADYLKGLGVSQVIDYRQGDIAGKAGAVDVVIDAVGGDDALDALRALRPGGHFATVANARVTAEMCAAAKIECSGSPGSSWRAPLSVLEQVGQLAETGKLGIHVDRSYPLARAADALQYLKDGHAEGKVVIAVSDSAERR